MTWISLRVWAAYEFAVGFALLTMPSVTLSLFGIDEPVAVWVRAVGAIAVSLGVYYWHAATSESMWFARASVLARTVLAALLAVLAFTVGPWQLAIFAGALVAGASWTWLAMRR